MQIYKFIFYIQQIFLILHKIFFVNREILKLAIPNIISNITVPLLGLVDMMLMGHLSSPAYIGAIALGGTIFSVLYSFFSFLRAGTTGFTAQSYGANDTTEISYSLYRSITIAVLASILIIGIQKPIARVSLVLLEGSNEVESLAITYFFVRIWAAPANMLLYCFNGWFIGMQNTRIPMAIAIIINVLNIILSIIFVVVMKQDVVGVALGTVIAQYCGLITALVFLFTKYKNYLIKIKAHILLDINKLKRFFKVNTDLMIRSILLVLTIAFFTNQSAKLGDNILSVNMILLQSFYIFSYFTDGFAYAGEALSGRFIGAGEGDMLRLTVRRVFFWSMAVAVLWMGIYAVAGEGFLRLFTDSDAVLVAARKYLPWLVLMPPLGCAAFTWDGIYTGATSSAEMRNAMLAAVLLFFVVWFAFRGLTPGETEALHLLLAAYFVHLAVRTIWLSLRYRRGVLSKISNFVLDGKA